MVIVEVPNVGNWATTTIECSCGKRITHVYLIGSIDGLDCGCGAPAYPLGWELMTEPEDAPTNN